MDINIKSFIHINTKGNIILSNIPMINPKYWRDMAGASSADGDVGLDPISLVVHCMFSLKAPGSLPSEQDKMAPDSPMKNKKMYYL